MYRLLQVILVLAVLPISAGAQSLPELCEEMRNVRVGQWVEYEMVAPQVQPGVTNMRFAIVGSEPADGEPHYWYEMKMETMITQMLVPGFPYDPSQVKRMVMKMGDEPAQVMPETMLVMMRAQMANNPALSTAGRCGDAGDAEEVGWETISVPGGSFRALHLRSAELQAEWWLSSEVGMVKFVGPGGHEMELAGHGSDAQSSLDERR